MYPGLFFTLWESMHINARALPAGDLTEAQIKSITAFLQAQCELVPCGGCSSGALTYFNSHVPNFKTGEDAFRWTVDLHNDVNRKTQKREYTYEEADSELQLRARKNYSNLLPAERRNSENHRKIKALETELVTLRQIVPRATTNDTLYNYIIAILILVIILLFFLIIMFAVLSKQHSNLASVAH